MYFCMEFKGLYALFSIKMLSKNKTLKKYYSISEVAEQFGVAESLLRYWEKEFPNIAPGKSALGSRRYTAEDIAEVGVVYNLLKVRGMKISAAREMLRSNKQGVMSTSEVIAHLQSVRAELMDIRKELGEL